MNTSDADSIGRDDLRNPWMLLATGFGLGLFPAAPGTVASLLAASVWVAVWSLGGSQAHLLLTAIGTPIAFVALAKTSSNRRLGDHRALVADEVIGQWMAFLFVPVDWVTLTLGFLCFRSLDILKPFPIRWVDSKVPGAWGILLDDVVCGLATCALLHLLLVLMPTLAVPLPLPN